MEVSPWGHLHSRGFAIDHGFASSRGVLEHSLALCHWPGVAHDLYLRFQLTRVQRRILNAVTKSWLPVSNGTSRTISSYPGGARLSHRELTSRACAALIDSAKRKGYLLHRDSYLSIALFNLGTPSRDWPTLYTTELDYLLDKTREISTRR